MKLVRFDGDTGVIYINPESVNYIEDEVTDWGSGDGSRPKVTQVAVNFNEPGGARLILDPQFSLYEVVQMLTEVWK